MTRLGRTLALGPEGARDDCNTSNPNETSVKTAQNVSGHRGYEHNVPFLVHLTGVSTKGKPGLFSIAKQMTGLVTTREGVTRMKPIVAGQYRGALAMVASGSVRSTGVTVQYGITTQVVYEADVDDHGIPIYTRAPKIWSSSACWRILVVLAVAACPRPNTLLGLDH